MSEQDAVAMEQTPAWAVWVGDNRDNRCVALQAEDREEARDAALSEADDYDEVYHIDGPYRNSVPGVWEIEFRTEHRERVVVEAPNQDYAEESADAERDYSGEYVQTVHTETRKLTTKEVDDGE